MTWVMVLSGRLDWLHSMGVDCPNLHDDLLVAMLEAGL